MQLSAYVVAMSFKTGKDQLMGINPIMEVGIVRMKDDTKTPRAQVVKKNIEDLDDYWKSFLLRLELLEDVKRED